jgi:hypothetical protein
VIYFAYLIADGPRRGDEISPTYGSTGEAEPDRHVYEEQGAKLARLNECGDYAFLHEA